MANITIASSASAVPAQPELYVQDGIVTTSSLQVAHFFHPFRGVGKAPDIVLGAEGAHRGVVNKNEQLACRAHALAFAVLLRVRGFRGLRPVDFRASNCSSALDGMSTVS